MKQRIAICKAVVNAQLDYAFAIIPYTKKEIDRLDRDQIIALKLLTKIDYNTDKNTILSIFDIPSIPLELSQ